MSVRRAAYSGLIETSTEVVQDYNDQPIRFLIVICEGLSGQPLHPGAAKWRREVTATNRDGMDVWVGTGSFNGGPLTLVNSRIGGYFALHAPYVGSLVFLSSSVSTTTVSGATAPWYYGPNPTALTTIPTTFLETGTTDPEYLTELGEPYLINAVGYGEYLIAARRTAVSGTPSGTNYALPRDLTTLPPTGSGPHPTVTGMTGYYYGEPTRPDGWLSPYPNTYGPAYSGIYAHAGFSTGTSFSLDAVTSFVTGTTFALQNMVVRFGFTEDPPNLAGSIGADRRRFQSTNGAV